jgi:hypothetical protein
MNDDSGVRSKRRRPFAKGARAAVAVIAVTFSLLAGCGTGMSGPPGTEAQCLAQASQLCPMMGLCPAQTATERCCRTMLAGDCPGGTPSASVCAGAAAALQSCLDRSCLLYQDCRDRFRATRG